MTKKTWAQPSPCDQCPWRLDVPVGKFPPERYEQLADTSRQTMGPVFACHKTHEGNETACAGWCAVGGLVSFSGRIAAMAELWDPADYSGLGPRLYPSYAAMAEANGVPESTMRRLLGEDY